MAPEGHRPRRRWLLVLAAVAALSLLAGGIAFAVLSARTADVVNEDVEFRAEPTPTAAPAEDETVEDPDADKTDPLDRFLWPHYGYSKDRRRYLPASASLRPPFRRVWSQTGRILLEFPPVIGGKSLYLLKNNAALYAIGKDSGRVRWKRQFGYLAASSPAYADGVVYITVLQREKNMKAGRVVAIRAGTGKTLWSKPLPSRSESSPLVDGDRVYFGSENGTVYAMRRSDGAVRWTFKARGAVKGGLALADGKLYFGDYAGRVYAIRQRDGSRAWETGTSGARFGTGSGNFYSTPAVAYGRVYIGNTDGKLYSFSSRDGRLAWSRSTGGFVYASPAVAQVPGGKPTVYAGSYSGRFYALDARTGRPRWVRSGYKKISGGATVIGDIVYFADLDRKETIGLGARTGRTVFKFGRGSFNPVVSDGRTIFLTGYSSLYALRPPSTKARREARAAERRARKARADRRREIIRDCRARAGRLHDRRGPRIRSFRRCVERERRLRTLAACRRRAEAAHDKRSRVLRSFRRCADRTR